MALAGLWSVAGVGELRLAHLRQKLDPAQIIDLDPDEWLGDSGLPEELQPALRGPTLRERGERVLYQARVTGQRVAFVGDREYPELLARVERHPPMLFFKGPGAERARRRVALVGTRRPDNDLRRSAREFGEAVARQGLTVVSGAAEGIDTQCHLGAMDHPGGETWAFLGSSLDAIDAYQKNLMFPLVERGATVFTDYPPGVRADRAKFPRRNRLISGASDATVLVLAPVKSGALYTAEAAWEQGRPVLALSLPFGTDSAEGGYEWVRAGKARPCFTMRDLFAAMNVDLAVVEKRALPRREEPVSEPAQRALTALERDKLDFDAWLARVAPTTPSALVSLIVELELAGRVVECPGRLYQAT